jgi:hypothetical protein
MFDMADFSGVTCQVFSVEYNDINERELTCI